MRHPRHDLLGQEPHRVVPSLRVVAVVEAEQQKAAESPDLVVHALDLLDDCRRRADQPIVLGAVFRGDVAVGNRLVMFQKLDDPDIGQQGQKVLPHHAAHLRADRQAPGLLVGIGDKDLAHQAPIGPARGAAAAPGPFLDRIPMAGDVGRVEVEAHRQEAVLAGQLQRVRALADPGDADRRVRFLEWLDVRPQRLQHQKSQC